jgi:hypothetical protein
MNIIHFISYIHSIKLHTVSQEDRLALAADYEDLNRQLGEYRGH